MFVECIHALSLKEVKVLNHTYHTLNKILINNICTPDYYHYT